MTDTITAQLTLTKDEMAEGIARASAFILPNRSLATPKPTCAQLQAWHGVAA